MAEPRDRNPPLHRQGHHLFPHALLAGDAQDGRLQPAEEGPHPRLPHRQRREDVEVARAPSSGRRRTWSTSTRPTCATTTPRSSAPGVDDLDLNLDEFVAKVNADLVGKVVNLASRTARFVEKTGPGRRVSRRRRAVRPGGRRRRRDRRGLRGLRLQPGDAARSWPPAIGPTSSSSSTPPGTWRKDPAQAGELQDVCTDRAEPVPAIGHLPGPRAAASWPSRPASCWASRSRDWEQVEAAALGHAGRPFRAHDEARRPRTKVDAMIESQHRGRQPAAASAAAPPPDDSDEPLAGRAAGGRRSRSTISRRSICGSPGSWRPKTCRRPRSC